MRYIGGKSLLLDEIDAAIGAGAENVQTVMDIFAGTSVVASHLKTAGYQVLSNDFLYFSYVLQKCHVELDAKPDFSELPGDPIAILNDLDFKNTHYTEEQCFIYRNYSPAGSARMFFRPENAMKIDLIRLTIEEWFEKALIDEKGYYYLLTSLLEAVPYVANIAGVYAAYLKFWDRRTYKPLVLEEPAIYEGARSRAFWRNYTDMLSVECDLLYADPPYNSREYLPNYHILETIARYDYPKIYGVTGMREYDEQKSDFCKKAKVAAAFEKLISGCRARYLLISYNNEGLLPTEELVRICEKYAAPNTFRLYEYEYRRYKNKIPNNRKGLKEQLYFLERS